jgi:hypothetical protein
LEQSTQAYLAGLFDGEGSITLHFTKHSTNSYSPQVQFVIMNIDQELLETVKKDFGFGKVYSIMPRDINRKVIHSYRITSFKDTLTAIDLILPFSRLKKKELTVAKNAIEYMIAEKTCLTMPWKPTNLKRFSEYIKEIRTLRISNRPSKLLLTVENNLRRPKEFQ